MGDDQQSLDYKKVAHVFGGLLLLLCGAIYHLWSAGTTEDANENAKQWVRIRELGEQGIKRDAVIEQLQKEGADREQRIRALEHWWNTKH